jgi:hypothetical protein
MAAAESVRVLDRNSIEADLRRRVSSLMKYSRAETHQTVYGGLRGGSHHLSGANASLIQIPERRQISANGSKARNRGGDCILLRLVEIARQQLIHVPIKRPEYQSRLSLFISR